LKLLRLLQLVSLRLLRILLLLLCQVCGTAAPLLLCAAAAFLQQCRGSCMPAALLQGDLQANTACCKCCC
jgi:hypothetical protein